MSGYGKGEHRFKCQEARNLSKDPLIPPPLGRSGVRVEKGKGPIDTYKEGEDPRYNTLVQKAWIIGGDPAINYRGKKLTPPVNDPLSLTLKPTPMVDPSVSKARVATITKASNHLECALRKGANKFMDEGI